ncbi:LuxR C-terminal-related transcriptional regulator [Actinoplanes sp. NPDC049548]|uniref:LuxR C-terminal-related transcriptional regulator n=1 Tax=Actinoplanes sp. NPDC049548 TaxID=3155152 RepID=UPI003425CB03
MRRRIVVCSPDQLRRDALAAYLRTVRGFTIIGEVADARRLLALTGSQDPDTAVIDAGFRMDEALTTVRSLRARHPALRLVLVYEHGTVLDQAAMRKSGATAVVPYSPGLHGLSALLRALPAGGEPSSIGKGLTARQRTVLLLVASGYQAGEIARMLNISPGTVGHHKRSVYAKLNATSAAQAITRAARLGLIEWTPSAHHPALAGRGTGRPGRSLLPVLLGASGPTLDAVQMTLIRHGFPMVRELLRAPVAELEWPRLYPGTVIRILVSPTPQQWRLGATLGGFAVLVHDDAVDHLLMEYALSQGVIAIIQSGDVADRLIPVLELAAVGYMAMDPAAGALLAESLWAAAAHPPTPALALTPREHDILRCIERNCTVRQTARALGIAAKTVENAQSHLFRKLGVYNRAAALSKAYALGLLDPESA